MVQILTGIIKRANLFIVLIILITAFLGYHALNIVIDPDFYSIFPGQNDRVDKLFRETGITDTLEMHLYLSVESETRITPGQLKLFYEVVSAVENHPGISESITPFNFITFRNVDGRLSVEPVSRIVPETVSDTGIFMERLCSEPLAQGFVTAENGQILSAFFVTESSINPEEFTTEFEEIIAPLSDYFTVHYSGDLPFAAATTGYIQKDLFLLLVLAVIIILVVLFASFRMLRAILLPVLTVVVGAVWAIGFSSLLGFKLTVVSVVLPTIVLAIGSSYTVHILSEYFREFGRAGSGISPDMEICLAVSHVLKTVILAGLTTIIGFCSLMLTSIAPVREFGLSVSFGIFACVVLSLFFLPSLLSKLSPPRLYHREKIRKGIISRVIRVIADSVIKLYPVYILVFIASIICAAMLFPGISRKVDYIGYFPPEDKIVNDSYWIINNSGGGQSVNITLKAPEGAEKYFLQKGIMEDMEKLQNAVEANENVIDLMSFYTILEQINKIMFGSEGLPENQGLVLLLSRYFRLIGDHDITYAADAEFVNEDYSQVTLFLKVCEGKTGKVLADRDILTLTDEIELLIKEYIPEECTSYIWGNTLLFYEAGEQIQHDQLFSTIISMILIALVSVIYFRSLPMGLLSLIPMIFAIAFNYILMALLAIPLDVTTVLVSNVAIGVGVDDAIHFLLQYRGRCRTGCIRDVGAIRETFMITGRPVMLTTVSIVAGFLMLCFASFKPIVYFGFLVSLSLTAAMISTLFFLPAFLVGINRVLIFLKKRV